jgi:hypothetical protein
MNCASSFKHVVVAFIAEEIAKRAYHRVADALIEGRCADRPQLLPLPMRISSSMVEKVRAHSCRRSPIWRMPSEDKRSNGSRRE